ncbi:hypothetical protein [Streptomyces sp. NPDC093225]|uniref:hypothetical protein n=1 Tax=Streptomyces sp. NPDC093225 TaxID=3366034 RepID=UPI00382C82D5
MAELFVWWVLAVVLQVFLTGPLSWLEWTVAAGAAVPAALGARAVRRASGARSGGGARALHAVLVWPVALVADTGRLAALTLRALRGRQVRGRFHTLELGRGTGAAWACTLLSAAPGAYAVGLGRGRFVLVHALPGPPGVLTDALTNGRRQ